VAGGLFAISLIVLALAASPLVLFILFVVMRGLGVGPLQITHSTVIAQWFRNQRGRVMGITVIIMWLFQGLYVPMLQDLLTIYSWRQIWQVLGVVVGVVVVPFIWLLTRDRPENFGLLPDGESQNSETNQTSEENWTLAEARRTPTFWIFALGRILMPAIGSALILHQISIFGVLGHEPVVAAQTFSMASIVAAASSIFAGVLVDRLRPGLVMVCQLATSLFMLVLAMTMTTPLLLVPYALAFGMNIGLGGVFDNAVWANLFGREHLGEIRGFVTTMMSVGIAVGPVVFGWSFDTYATYNPVLIGFGVLVVIQMILAYVAPPPQRQIQPDIAVAVGD
jgi:MFS family permease